MAKVNFSKTGHTARIEAEGFPGHGLVTLRGKTIKGTLVANDGTRAAAYTIHDVTAGEVVDAMSECAAHVAGCMGEVITMLARRA